MLTVNQTQYRTDGKGYTASPNEYATTTQALYIMTNKLYTSKVINKKVALRNGLFQHIRDEVAIYKRLPPHRNVVSLQDYFEVCLSSILSRRSLTNNSPRQTQGFSFAWICTALVISGTGCMPRTLPARRELTFNLHELDLTGQQLSDAVKIVRTLISTLKHIHGSDIVHRSACPSVFNCRCGCDRISRPETGKIYRVS